MTKHLITGLAIAVVAALASAVAVLWDPTITGKVIVGSSVAAWLGIWLGKHRHAKRGIEAMTVGAAISLALLIWLPTAVPFVVFGACAGPGAAHYLNPRRARVVRTTRGVRKPVAKAAGGRSGRPGETHRPRSPRPGSSRPVGKRPGPARPRPAVPPQPAPTWPDTDPWRRTDALPWAGEGQPLQGAPEQPAPKRLRKNPARPSQLHRSICSGCASGDCASCPRHGCECPWPHLAAAPRYVPDDLPDEPGF